MRNAFANNMATDIKLSKAQLLPIMIQSGEFLGALLGKFVGRLIKVAVIKMF